MAARTWSSRPPPEHEPHESTNNDSDRASTLFDQGNRSACHWNAAGTAVNGQCDLGASCTAAAPCNLTVVDPNLRVPYLVNWNLGVQHAAARKWPGRIIRHVQWRDCSARERKSAISCAWPEFGNALSSGEEKV
jgi:hypothetical protein